MTLAPPPDVRPIRRILVATDFAASSSPAESYALWLASTLGARCHVVHVIERIAIRDEDDDAEVQDFYKGLARKAERLMGERRARFQDAGVSCTTQVSVGNRWEGILAAADAEDVDLIVLGSHPTTQDGRPYGRPYLGTTSHRVFVASQRPLLVVRG